MDTRQAYERLCEIDSLFDAVVRGIATQDVETEISQIKWYELDAYLEFCETRIKMLKEERERRKAFEQ